MTLTPAPWPLAQPRSMRDARAEALLLRLHDQRKMGGEYADLDDLRSFTDGWSDEQIEAAVNDLVAAGRAELEARSGHVVVWLILESEEAAA